MSREGSFDYAAGVIAETVAVPSTADLKTVSVIADAAADATVQIGGGDVITVPAGTSFSEIIHGAAAGADVVIGGTPQAYYVSWVSL